MAQVLVTFKKYPNPNINTFVVLHIDGQYDVLAVCKKAFAILQWSEDEKAAQFFYHVMRCNGLDKIRSLSVGDTIECAGHRYIVGLSGLHEMVQLDKVVERILRHLNDNEVLTLTRGCEAVTALKEALYHNIARSL